MGLSQALHNAYTGLVASSRRAEITAHNIANATTEGYARRDVQLAAHTVDGMGMGVRVEGVRLAQNEALTEDRRHAEAELGYQAHTQESAALLAKRVGDPDDVGSLFSRYENLEQSLRALTDTPQSTLAQFDVLTKAQDLARAFNDMNDANTQLREDADRQIAREVTQLNETLSEIVELNRQVQRSTVVGEDASELVAQRNGLIDKIADLMPVEVIARENGGVTLMSSNGLVLADHTAAVFGFTQATVIDPTMDIVGGSPGALSTLTVNGVDITPTTQSSNRLGDGRLSALFETRDVTAVEFQTRIDALADDLIDRFAAAGVEPSITPGDPGVFTDAGAAPTGVAGLAGRLSVNALVDPDQGGSLAAIRDGIGVAAGDVGDNTHAIALLGAMTSAQTAPAGSDLVGSKSATDFAADFATLVSTEAQTSEAIRAMRAARFNTYYQAETTAIGVDMDYEVQELTLIQNAYSANARVIEVVDSLFRRLMEI